MPQFAVYRNQNPHTRGHFPLLVDVQAELLQDLQTRVVIPLSQAAALIGFPMEYLMPSVVFEGQSYLLITPQLAGVALRDLGAHVGSLAAQQRVISSAIDFLMRGF